MIGSEDVEIVRLVAALQCVHSSIQAASSEVKRVRAAWNAELMAGFVDVGLLQHDLILLDEMRALLQYMEQRHQKSGVL